MQTYLVAFTMEHVQLFIEQSYLILFFLYNTWLKGLHELHVFFVTPRMT